MMWTAIGCLIAGLILLISMFAWDSASSKDQSKRAAYETWRPRLQVGYLLLFMASAVLFLLW